MHIVITGVCLIFLFVGLDTVPRSSVTIHFITDNAGNAVGSGCGLNQVIFIVLARHDCLYVATVA